MSVLLGFNAFHPQLSLVQSLTILLFLCIQSPKKASDACCRLYNRKMKEGCSVFLFDHLKSSMYLELPKDAVILLLHINKSCRSLPFKSIDVREASTLLIEY
ncbi:uncharacterized protein B0P05DRAFT_532482 [Gilbertella persicaria]|uniref:uncharacterized protein n=1 Tax=Gilbertella persicaria TaxID=101096 RepID=UPI00221E55EE|nr:uncharacterized protein B0P05DRAFT_532393 [Gilbertella persicaria]XP_051437445.1 uncharacterized protein B0P05DRAFT_532482 [Gilbertella persicaria]KAI8087817.1 hypothetical protein B0P05DRAFT_532393 [Gilbertella persicaria]KAI8087835.1 hypothetical protein B0P05DRAFT_532482 [Gilbertella persicaria]